MKRIVEPELMDEVSQAIAYADADFEEAHSGIVKFFQTRFPELSERQKILDIGCGPGDLSFRFAHLFRNATVTAVDGAASMLELARNRAKKEPSEGERIRFVQAYLPFDPMPAEKYDLIVSNSLLHHLHEPDVLWQIIKNHSTPETAIFIADLCRPDNKEAARSLVNNLAADEPEVLQHDFFYSLLAAFRPEEVREQLKAENLNHLSVEQIDHHLFVFGYSG